MENNCPKIVYHYCSLESFKKIIENKTVRLTNITKSNDRAEIKYYYEEFEQILRTSCKKFCKEHVENNDVKELFKNIDYEALMSGAVINDTLVYYAACFSSEADLLSQWRGYADDGVGVAIGFNVESLKKPKETPVDKARFSQISYGIEGEKEKLTQLIENKLLDAKRKHEKYNSIGAYESAISEIVGMMRINAVFYKNILFQEEKEWRFVYYPFGSIFNLKLNDKYREFSKNRPFYDRMSELMTYEHKVNDLVIGKLSFGITGNKITSYVDMSFANTKKPIIEEIIIGPKAEIDDNDLRLFLIANGFDLTKIEIKKSKATYR